jgi:membrane protein implicated in regulation of membrane protease activity
MGAAMTALIFNAIPGELWAALAAIVAAVAAWLVARRSGVRAERDKLQRNNAESYRKTTEAMQDADFGSGDLDDDTRWLSKRKDKR